MSIDEQIEIIKDLRNGHIPQDILESDKIVPEQDETSQLFADHMQQLWKRLINATEQGGYNPEKHKVRFLLLLTRM